MWFAILRRKTAHYHRYIVWSLLCFVLVIFLFVSLKLIFPYLKLVQDAISGPINIMSVILPKQGTLKSQDNRTNILLLGIGGGNHEGPTLTDSIMIASVNTDLTSKNKPPIILISLPRDIYIDELENKINSAYTLGNEKKDGAGLLLAKTVVSKVTGLPIHYAFIVDFSGFEQAIDYLGGVDVIIENSFDDLLYPITGKENDLCDNDPEFKCRFEHLHFDKGPAHLTGEMALKFVRSRYSESDEGTDFARARRQQLVIEAVKAKVFSSSTLLNPQKMSDIYNAFKTRLVTDINPQEMGTFLKIALQYKKSVIKTIVLGMDFFNNPPIDSRGWILLPKEGSFERIHDFIKTEILKADQQSSQ